jgi:uncharacterized membrane protein YbhN (UPF0104 family)
MSEHELGKALLQLDATALAAVPEVHHLTWKVLERDRRRVRLLTGLTVLVWLLAAALILVVLVTFGLLFPQQAKLLHDIEAGQVTAAQRDEIQHIHLVAFQMGTLVIAFSVAVLAAAALCTVLLVFTSRRATLRQVNASLLEISEQLKQLRQALGK